VGGDSAAASDECGTAADAEAGEVATLGTSRRQPPASWNFPAVALWRSLPHFLRRRRPNGRRAGARSLTGRGSLNLHRRATGRPNFVGASQPAVVGDQDATPFRCAPALAARACRGSIVCCVWLPRAGLDAVSVSVPASIRVDGELQASTVHPWLDRTTSNRCCYADAERNARRATGFDERMDLRSSRSRVCAV